MVLPDPSALLTAVLCGSGILSQVNQNQDQPIPDIGGPISPAPTRRDIFDPVLVEKVAVECTGDNGAGDIGAGYSSMTEIISRAPCSREA